MRGPNSSALFIVGDIGTMGEDNRLTVPARVRDNLTWFPEKHAKPFPLIADLRDKGLVRLYPASTHRQRLEALRQRVVDNHPDPVPVLGALSDRYRDLTYYSSDSRVHCGSAIGWHLRIASQHRHAFFVEARGDCIEVVTLERRAARLQDLRNELELPDD
jgi:hypothetical protein